VMYALSYPDRFEAGDFMKRLDFGSSFSLSFSPPDTSVFPLLPLAYECLRRGGVYGAALNGADERAVGLFLEGKISFTDIFRSVEKAALTAPEIKAPSLSDIYEADKEAMRRVDEFFSC
ncbi:MAG: 1-deoxy-D-xylulose-5-phosphate reductoisomerase, partial [Clostridia bacterium]|nr:1-deoxy-D-xylulose-5-phosphate reductoisomerase [Clostridia bacterium]